MSHTFASVLALAQRRASCQVTICFREELGVLTPVVIPFEPAPWLRRLGTRFIVELERTPAIGVEVAGPAWVNSNSHDDPIRGLLHFNLEQ